MENSKFLGLEVLGQGLVTLPKGKRVGNKHIRVWLQDPKYLLKRTTTAKDILWYLFNTRIRSRTQRVQILGLVIDTEKVREERKLTTLDKVQSAVNKVNPRWTAEHHRSQTGYIILDSSGKVVHMISYDEALATPIKLEEILGWK